jgi:hypothetical protein
MKGAEHGLLRGLLRRRLLLNDAPPNEGSLGEQVALIGAADG